MKKNKLTCCVVFAVILLMNISVICSCMPEKTYDKIITLPDSNLNLGKFEITSAYGDRNGSERYCILNNQKNNFKEMLTNSQYFFCENYVETINLSPKSYSYKMVDNSDTIWFADAGDIWACQFYTDSIIHFAKAQNTMILNDNIILFINCGLFACVEPTEIDVPYKTIWSWEQIKQLLERDTQVDDGNKTFVVDCWSQETEGNFLIEYVSPFKTLVIYDEINNTLTISGDYYIEA